MYVGYNLKLNLDKNDQIIRDYYKIGKKIYDNKKNLVKEKLDSFILNDGSLDGTKMQNNWFPQIKSDIFLSHSHKDEVIAIALAGLFKEISGLELFIDSCIWGYSNNLLKNIDDRYCYDVIKETYNYESRNYSTSHVHMMLSTALTMMIDKTECLFFLNTPNSITASQLINETESPWIYSEIAMAKMIRKKQPHEHREFYKSKSFVLKEHFKVKYELNVNHLIPLSSKILCDWIDSGFSDPYDALDKLYGKTNIIRETYE